MTEEEIERINKFVDLRGLKSCKETIKGCIFIIIGFFMFFVGDSVKQNYNLLASKWMIFAILALVIIVWGIYLLHNLEKRQFDFFLFWGVAGIYNSIEFFALGISHGINQAQISPIILATAISLDAILIAWLIWYRYQLFTGKKRISSGTPNYKIMLPLIIIIAPVSTAILKSAQFQDAVVCSIYFALGYIESVHASLFGNYYVAEKYQQYIKLKY
jgi:hypothetical protein